MAEQGQRRNSSGDIRYTRNLNTGSVVALGSLAMLGLGVFLLSGEVISFIGSRAPIAYILLIAFFTPVILVLGERSSVIRGRGGLFNFTRTANIVWIQFWTGWFLAGGYVALGAVFAWIVGNVVSDLVNHLFAIQLTPTLASVLVISLLIFLRTPGLKLDWRAKTIATTIGFLIFLFVVIRLWVNPIVTVPSLAILPVQDPLAAVPVVALGLWGISFVLDYRDELQQPKRKLIPSLLLTLVIGGLIGFFVTYVLVTDYSGFILNNQNPFSNLAGQIGFLVQTLVESAAVILSLLGLNQAITSNERLVVVLSQRGLLPGRLLTNFASIRPFSVLGLPLLVLLLVVFLPISLITGFAASTLLLAISLAVVNDAFRARPNLPPRRRFKLPLNPLFPAYAAIVCLAMAFAQPLKDFWLLLSWVVIGAIYFAFFGRRGVVAVRQQEAVVAERMFDRERAGTNILLYVEDRARIPALFLVVATLARARQSQIIILQILLHREDEDATVNQQLASETAHLLRQQIDDLEGYDDLTVDSLVRIAPDISEGIKDTVWDERSTVLLLERPAAEGQDSGLTLAEVDDLVRSVPAEVVIINGEMSSDARRILIPATSNAHNHAALALAADLAKQLDGSAQALGILRFRANSETIAEAERAIRVELDKLDDPSRVDVKIHEVVDTPDDFRAAGKDFDLAILGASEEGFLSPTTFFGFPADAADIFQTPTLVVKKKETSISFQLRQIWESLFRVMPTLDRGEQATVYRAMQNNARAGVDFYTLIILAAGIAFLGLLLNNSSVIIGAMLIAPLMSPILAMAHSIVMGNLRMLRTAVKTTANGILMAIGVSLLIALLLFAFGFNLEPTSEVLGRTSPNLLDLLVAILSGAAAAYAISRSQLAAALPGVAIAAALVPPLCVVGYGLGIGLLNIALGAGLLFLTNLAAIIVSAAAVFLLVGFRPPVRAERGQQAQLGLRIALAALLVISIILLFITVVSTRIEHTRSSITDFLNAAFLPRQASIENINISNRRDNWIIEFLVLDYQGTVDETDIDDIQQKLSQIVGGNVLVNASIVRSNAIRSDGRPRPTQSPTPTPTVLSTQAPKSRSTPKPPASSTLSGTAIPTLSPSITVAPE